VPKVKRPCPRGLYNGCPIPRELCTEDHEATGKWNCLKFLNDLDFFLFGRADEEEDHDFVKESEDVVSLEDLMRVLGEEEDV
jgi:hypothetical protein